ncbi:PREDICTED: coiled-coil domain-containing protein 68 [Cariama cristata]|uniref:coiled-coil domain-containing protein 68 n=1 Tax=Cariama cristata TaxID=54380 RepID=UPI0005201E35|nr:PREDICTED: coiled-coil domain-containing protein 68 [Cariama cristata]
MTTLLLTEQITREDRGSEGNYVLYGSSRTQITEEAEYVKKGSAGPFAGRCEEEEEEAGAWRRSAVQPEGTSASDGREQQGPGEKPRLRSRSERVSGGVTGLPLVSGDKPESKSSGWSCSPVARMMKETEEQLLLVSRENQVLKIKLEATREAGVQALRSASQKLYENYQAQSEELKKRLENEKQQIQAYNLQQEEKLQQSSENASRLAESIEEKCTRVAEMEARVQRMEEEKKTLIEKKRSFEKMLQQMMSRNEDSKRCLDLQSQISTLQEQIHHLQRVIQAQHHSLRSVIQEAQELNNQLRSQDKKIENLTEKLSSLEAQNKELKDRVEFWSGQPKSKVSKAVWTDPPRDFGAFRPSPYLMLTRLRKQEN